jgi:hypothetical protein
MWQERWISLKTCCPTARLRQAALMHSHPLFDAASYDGQNKIPELKLVPLMTTPPAISSHDLSFFLKSEYLLKKSSS